MNINKLTTGIDGTGRSKNTQDTPNNPKTGSENAKTNGGQHTDQVRLSARSMSIQQIEAEVSKLPDVDDSTIDRIRNAIDSGEYKIDYQKLAGKMLSFEEKLN